MQYIAVYILASKPNGTLYIGVTLDLVRRIWQHREGHAEDAFTKRYGVTRLVHYELFDELLEARRRERLLKGWRRAWKKALIEERNPRWEDLWEEIVEGI